MILLKLLLVPLLLAAVTLAGRRWGQSVAGWLGSFPIVAGPILLIAGPGGCTSLRARIRSWRSCRRWRWMCAPKCWQG